ncbi:hypothetical protein [Leifsonia sp. 2MCAF36]|uniref:hypothetical protein n=1 Tax=Leifsonia sp. 2MCAF36 TaxID=3232988 RepID=UPI003F9C5730
MTGIGLAGGALLSVLLGAPAAVAATAAAPEAAPAGLSIAISDGVAATASGSTSKYTATVTNDGTAPVTGKLVITLPAQAKYSEAGGAHVEKSDAVWQVTVPAGKSVTHRVTADIGRIPKGEVRVTTLATLYAADDGSRILVRAADANAIQGVVDPAHTVGQKPAKAADSGGSPALLVVGVAISVVLLALAATGVVWLRRRTRRASPERVP